MAQLDTPRVYSAIVKSLGFCVTDIEHDPYDREFDNWDFRDINERLCLMIVHRLIIEFGAWNFIKNGFVSRWLAKEPWGNTDEERQTNLVHCYHQSNLLSYIIIQVGSDPRGQKEIRKARLFGEQSQNYVPSGVENFGIGELMTNFDIIASIEGGAPRIQERSAEEQRLRRLHRTAMVLHPSDNSEPLGIDSIITTESSEERTRRNDLIMEADRQLRTQGLLSALTQRRLENMREILQIESERAEQTGPEEDSSIGILRDIPEHDISNGVGGNEGYSGDANADVADAVDGHE